MNLITRNLLAAGFAATMAFNATAQEPPNANTVLASVDGTDITIGHVIALSERLPARYQDLPDEVLYDAIVDQLIQQTVLMNVIMQELDTRLTIGLENEKRAFLASELMAKISQREVSDEELQEAYLARYDDAIPEQEFNASHILVATIEEAVVLIGLLEDGAEFATLAIEHSTGPSGPGGGSLGWFGKGAMVPEFEQAVLLLAIGENSPPVETQFGWHIVHLDDLRNISVPTLDEIRPELAAELQQGAIEREIVRLTEAAEITRNEVDVDPSIIRAVSLLE